MIVILGLESAVGSNFQIGEYNNFLATVYLSQAASIYRVSAVPFHLSSRANPNNPSDTNLARLIHNQSGSAD
jgi:hypothetical protein